MTTDSIKKEFRCKGRPPGTTHICNTILCLTDGKNIFVKIYAPRAAFAAEVEFKEQAFTEQRINIQCVNCGYINRWYRNKSVP